MTAEVRRSLVLAAVGLFGGFAMVVALFGTGELLKRNAAVNPSAETPAASGTSPHGTETGDGAGEKPSAEPPHAALGALSQGETGPADRSPAPQEADGAPSFDIVRVEPDGASVIAGRAAPNARIEVLRDGRPFASVQADAAGQFALTPPDLPPGTSEIALRATGTDGMPLPGRESVTVVVAARRDAKPLIALSAPDKPTRVLSQPDAPDAADKPATAPADTAAKAAAKAAAGGSAPVAAETMEKGEGKGAAERRLRIVSVDAQGNGRLDVTSQAPPGTSLRLYLNDTMVASGQPGPDGRTAFTIGRGVKPGAYRIRVDSVDAKGKVKNRAEVAFAYPDSSPPTRFAGTGPADRPGQAQAGTAAEMPSTSKPPAGADQAPSGGGPEEAKPAATSGGEATRRTALAGEVKPAPSLAGVPPQAGWPSAPKTDRPAAPGAASLAAASGAVAPAPEWDRQAAAALAPSLPAPAAAAPTGTVFVPEISTARITRGDSLWQISRRTYGRGNRYTVIYDANQDQIRDPNRIYPGQMFVLPRDEPPSGKPTAKQGSDRRT